MKTKIDVLKLELFKGFVSTEVKFSEGLNLLVGGNNSGKSSILQSIHLAFHFLKLTDGISAIDIKKGGAKVPGKSRLRGVAVKSLPLPFHEDSYLSEGLKKRSNREKSTKIGISTKNLTQFLETVTFPGGNLLIISSDINGQPGGAKYQQAVKELIRNDFNLPLYIPTFSGVANREEVKMAEVVRYYLTSGKANEVLRNQLAVIVKNRKKIDKLNKYLKGSFGVEIVSNDTKEIYISSLYKDEKYNHLDISSAGSGFQQILQILVYIVTANSNIILIDEADAHLHYSLQNGLYDILRELVEDGKQIILATHSQVFINRAIQHKDRLILVNRSLHEQKSLEDYSEGLKALYENGLIDENKVTQGGVVKLIDIEDESGCPGFNVVNEWLRRLDIKEPQYRIISGGDHIFGYLATVHDVDGVTLSSVILRDSDSLPEIYLSKIEKKRSKSFLKLVHWRRHEIENYLLNEVVLMRVLRSKGIRNIKAADIKNMIEAIVSENIDTLLDALEASLEGKLTKYYRELGIEYGVLGKLNRERRREIKDSLTYPYSLLPGKEIVGLLKQGIHRRYKVSVSEVDIAKGFHTDEIPSELKNSMKGLL